MQIILFDADGVTIQPTEPFSKQYQKKHGVPSDAFLKDFFGGIFHDCTTGKADLKEVLRPTLASEWKWKGTVEDFLQEWFSSEHFPNTEVLEIIKKLREKGAQCFLATNNEKYRTAYIRKEMGFDTVFDGIYSSCDVGHRKPSSEFFTYVLRDIGVPAENVVYFDNEEEMMVEAKRLGIRGYIYENPEQIRTFLK